VVGKEKELWGEMTIAVIAVVIGLPENNPLATGVGAGGSRGTRASGDEQFTSGCFGRGWR